MSSAQVSPPLPILARTVLRVGRALLCLAVLAPARTAFAENPAWPTSGREPAELADPEHWPDDPGYGFDIEGGGASCNSAGQCWSEPSGGQWNMWSWVPPQNLTVEGWRDEETSLGAGTWTDMAWQHSTGDPRVVIAVLDSGIKWEYVDLVHKHYLNVGELSAVGLDPRCLPEPPAGHVGDPLDVDGDGVLGFADWFAGQTPGDANALRESLDIDGNGNGIADPGDLIVLCTNGVDEDDNGYEDDISGWDFLHDDNDPADDTRFGHGTGEARDSAAEGDNGVGDIGFCPRCRVLMVRVADSFVADAQNYAKGVVFAVDSGARVVQEALGTVNHTTFMRRAQDYAYASGALVVASAADENSLHHNYPGTANHTLYVHAIRYAGGNPQAATSYLAFNNCTNYGAQLVLSAPGTGCSSEATGVTSGIAGLVLSASMAEDRPGGPLDPPLRAEELRQLLLMNVDDIDIPESQPDHDEWNDTLYPSGPGWDERFGYGRVNTYKAVVAVRAGRVPPEVDIVHPDWFRVIDPEREPAVSLRGRIDAERAESFDYVIEWAPGIEPDDEAFTTLREATGVTEAVEGQLASWDVEELMIENDGTPPNRYTVTVRIRVVAHYGGEVGDAVGEHRRAFAIRRDPTLKAGFPVALGTRHASDTFPAASGEESPKLADIDGDGKLEIVYGDADGFVHAFNEDATEVEGYPVQLGVLRALDPAGEAHHLDGAAYASGDVPAADVAATLSSGLAIGDLDGDGSLEIVAASMEGRVHVLHAADGTPAAGFPIDLPEVLSGDPLRGGPTSPLHKVQRGVFAAVALYDLDGDDALELIVPGLDGYLHVYRADGTVQPGFPVEIVAPFLQVNPADAFPGRITTSPAVGDADGDGIPDIAIGSNQYGSDRNTAAAHLVHGDGNLHAGGPEHEHWPIRIDSWNLLPFVGEGLTSPIAMADVNDDGRPDLAIAGAVGRSLIADARQPARAPGEEITSIVIMNGGDRGPGTDIRDSFDRPLLNTFAAGAFGDLEADGQLDYITGGAGLRAASAIAGGFVRAEFTHQVGAWDTAAGAMLHGFPRAIEDYMFFVNPSVADVSGDGYPETLVGSGGYYLHAWDACGREPEGWPKFVGGWVTSSAAVGDVDGDELLEVAIATRAGYLFLFDTDGPADGAIGWSEYRHDNHNTGNFEEPLSNGGRSRVAETPIACGADGGVDGGGGAPGDPGCDCAAVGAGRPGADAGALGVVVAALGVVAGRRRRRATLGG